MAKTPSPLGRWKSWIRLAHLPLYQVSLYLILSRLVSIHIAVCLLSDIKQRSLKNSCLETTITCQETNNKHLPANNVVLYFPLCHIVACFLIITYIAVCQASDFEILRQRLISERNKRQTSGSSSSGSSSNPQRPVKLSVNGMNNPNFVLYRTRLETYSTFPEHVKQFLNPKDLAFAGFFFAGYQDCVRCFCCGLGLRSWRPGDNVYREHKRHKADCKYLKAQLAVLGPDILSDTNSGSLRNYTDLPRDGQPAQTETPNTPEEANLQVSLPPEGAVMSAADMSTGTEQRPHSIVPVSGVAVSRTPPVSLAIANCVGATAGSHPNQAPGCIEKSTQNVSLLKVLKKENDLLQKQFQCRICLQRSVKELFLPCGDLYTCSACAKILTHCPCGEKILATVSTYFV